MEHRIKKAGYVALKLAKVSIECPERDKEMHGFATFEIYVLLEGDKIIPEKIVCPYCGRLLHLVPDVKLIDIVELEKVAHLDC